ncbi:MAG: class I SAM-dependent methyltransferase [Streptosporangiales bacterium]|nr:class I SAM-dependent methyltransferase [Streptosporangiales bacterium]MBO0889444.1 class I SAM-dependent methyltransferase [Acidothermales bacterium]
MPELLVRLPHVDEVLSQDQEYCLLVEDGKKRRIRFHDYGEIYSIPGLYEKLFADLLKCSSPEMIATLLADEVERTGESVADLHVLDLGAGNGMVGEQLRARGVRRLVAVDIIEEAAEAARRDRPDVYQRYHVGDIRDLPADARDDLAARDINCMTCVAALGFGDIPPTAFLAAYDLVPSGGWIAFNIKDTFLDKRTGNGFAALIREMIGDGRLRVCTQRTYTHRLSVSGDKLPYVAMVARKA